MFSGLLSGVYTITETQPAGYSSTGDADGGDPNSITVVLSIGENVTAQNFGEEQPGMLDYALWYRDRLYLFRSRETMALFNKDPMRFANQY